MKSLLLATAVTLAGVSLALGVAPQKSTVESPSTDRGLVHVGDRAGERGQVVGTVQTSPASAADWATRLQAADLDARESALDEFLQAAEEDPALREQLETWSQGQGELAWTARLAQRLLDGGSSQGTRPRGGSLWPNFPSPLGQLDHPWAGSLLDDPLGHDLFDGWRPGGWPWGGSPFAGLDLQDLGGTHQGESISVQAGPDGVRVEVRTQSQDGEERQVYEADSMEALLDAHPELRGKVGAQGSLGFPGAPGIRPWSMGPRSEALPSDRRVLGVYLRANLKAGGELVVQQVQPGSLAERLGVQPGDVLLHLDGGEIHSRDDIARKLMERADEDPIRLGVRRAGQAQVLTWEPGALLPGDRPLGDRPRGAEPLRRVPDSESQDE